MLESRLKKMFVVQFMNTGIILFLLNAQVEEIEFPDYIPILKGEFKRFDQ